jgi:Tfp pilus assembly protein PilX
MSPGAIAGIVVAILIIAALLFGLALNMRRRRLRERFGPEYDRVVREHDSQREAEAELAQRERRIRALDIRPLSPTARAQYSAEWTAVQQQFVDAPQAAVTGALTLVTAVMRDRGYPTEDYDQEVADLSVEHAAILDHFRAAHDISQRASAGDISTEDLRQAMIHYRALFTDLLGQPADAAAGTDAEPAATTPGDPVPAGTVSGSRLGDGLPGDGRPGTDLPGDGLPADTQTTTGPAGSAEPAASQAPTGAATDTARATRPDPAPDAGDPVVTPQRER